MSKKVTTNKQSKQSKQASCRTKLPYEPRNHLLAPGERRFYRYRHEPAARGRWLIAFRPRLADLITTENAASNHSRKIGMKHVDFALLTPRTTRIVAAIAHRRPVVQPVVQSEEKARRINGTSPKVAKFPFQRPLTILDA